MAKPMSPFYLLFDQLLVSVDKIREMVSYELGKEIENDVFFVLSYIYIYNQ